MAPKLSHCAVYAWAMMMACGGAHGSAAAPKDCRERNNDTAKRLLECIRAPALWHHLEDFQKIADENPGNNGHGSRDTGTPGYKASADYVANLMRQAGYRVHIQTYRWKHSAPLAPARSGVQPSDRMADAAAKSDTDYNVIADSPYGDPDHVIVVDAHLDSIYGAGMLDNASGSSTILEIALNMAHTPTRNRLRYIWFGGEELGLLGSHYYTRTLRPAALRKIAFDIDVDVTATPNFAVLIADPGHARKKDEFPPNVVPDSQIGNRRFEHYFRSIGIAARLASFGNDGTDSLAFSLAGVPNTGILTQQNCCKHHWEVLLWGGFPGNFEGKIPGHNGGCVDQPRRWCDNLSNNDRLVLEFVSKAVADVAFRFANDGGH